MKEASVTVWRIKAGSFKPATLRPIGGEHPTLRTKGGNKPRKRINTPVATLIVGAAKFRKRNDWAWNEANAKPSA